MARLDITGGAELEKAIHDWSANSAKAVKAALEAAGDAAVEEARKTSAWSDRTGALRASVKRGSVKHKANEASVEIYPDGTSGGKRMAEVGFVLEYGRGGKVFRRSTSRGNTKRYVIKPMAPRPWLRPAIEDGADKIQEAMEKAWAGGLGNG